jgi:large subunit ribosomal protein L10
MNRQQKAEIVEKLSSALEGAPFVALADYRGVSVPEIGAFRDALREGGTAYMVVKNTLVRRAVAGTPYEGLDAYLSGMTGLVISGDDPIASAKVLREASKELEKVEKFELKGGYFDGDILDGAAIGKVADLPSKEELLSQLLMTIQEGPRQLVGVIQAPARDLVNLLKNYENKLADGEA